MLKLFQLIFRFCRLTGNINATLGFTISFIGDKAHALFHVGSDSLLVFKSARLRTKYSGKSDTWYDGIQRPSSVELSHSELLVEVSNEDGSAAVEVRGKVIGFLPLRNRRNNEHTYIGEGMTEYTITKADGSDLPEQFVEALGVTGMGISEYLDQNVNPARL